MCILIKSLQGSKEFVYRLNCYRNLSNDWYRFQFILIFLNGPFKPLVLLSNKYFLFDKDFFIHMYFLLFFLSDAPSVGHIFLQWRALNKNLLIEFVYGPEAYLMHLTDRCRFLNCSVREGRSRLFWAQMALAALVAFSGPKKSRFQGPPLQKTIVMDFPPIQIHTSRPIQTTATLIVIMYCRHRELERAGTV